MSREALFTVSDKLAGCKTTPVLENITASAIKNLLVASTAQKRGQDFISTIGSHIYNKEERPY